MRPNRLSPVASLGIAAFVLPIAVAVGTSGCASTVSQWEEPTFYPLAPRRPRIQFLTKFAESPDMPGEPGRLMACLIGEVPRRGSIRKPTGVAAHDGVIYVADPGLQTVLVLNLKERFFGSIEDRGAGKLRFPVAIAIDRKGNKFVADTRRNQVVQFNDKNEYVQAFGNPRKLRPTGVAVDDEFLYVVNRGRHRVEVLSRRTRKTVRTFGELGKREGRFNIPTSLSIDQRGHLFVTDVANARVQEFDPKGNFVRSYGFPADGFGTLARPRGTSVDRDGRLYTVDAALENVQMWDTSNAQLLLAFGGPGAGPGDMSLPASVHVNYELAEYFRDLVDPEFDLENVILVANNYGPNKVAVYGLIKPKDPWLYPGLSLLAEGSRK